jgi:enoyl-CoA hydratase/carnithine racemase
MDAILFDTPARGVALITINRPERRNALGQEVREGLFAAWRRFEDDPALKVAILTGAGEKAFCAGGDLREMADTVLEVPPLEMFPILGQSIEITKPTIAAVNGVAFAGGWLMAQGCDLCIASTTAQFAITEAKVGRGAPWAVPLITMIPQRIMMEILLTGRAIGAERAYEIGLVNQVVEADRLIDTAVALAQEIAANAPLSVVAAKETVRLATEMGQSAALRAARHLWHRVYTSQDAQEGPRAFSEKRLPNWKGL